MSRRSWIAAFVLVLAASGVLRGLWLQSDPPVTRTVGIVWHDEGVWAHNARNKVLWGTWRTDAWNPLFISPVFTGLEYAVFSTAGVGTWQARSVSAVSGLVAIAALMAGLAVLRGRRAAIAGGLLLGTNYVFVMWNRAALLESTMTAFLLLSWASYAASERRQVWGWLAGLAAVLAWFTKAASAFFIVGLALEALLTWRRIDRAAASRGTLLGLTVAGVAGLALVLPHWPEYQFYNWQVSVALKPEYSLPALLRRASWLPMVQGFFSRTPLVFAAAMAGMVLVAARWRASRPGERLLVWWVALGLLELIVHDSGNERRYVMFIPALVALAVLAMTSAPETAPGQRPALTTRLAAAPGLLFLGYLLAGTLLRPIFLDEVLAGLLSRTVRLSALASVGLTALLVWSWPARARRVPTWMLVGGLAITCGSGLLEFGRWARVRTDENYRASRALAAQLPEGTLVQGKLANGLAFENRIRPLYVANGFGNYADRLRRDDARYILTYDLPRVGFESSPGLIQEILERYPDRRTVAAFEVDETPGPDRAVLIDKFPDRSPSHARD